MAGNPIKDVIASKQRFNDGIEPILKHKGFKRIDDKSHTMIDYNKKIIILCMSCPSDTKYPGQKRDLIRKLKKIYGRDYTFYLNFNRPKSEWIHKPVYGSILKQFIKFNSLTGVVIGVEQLLMSLEKIQNKELVYNI